MVEPHVVAADPIRALRRGELAVARAVREGLRYVVYWEGLDAAVEDRLRLLGDLQQALRDGAVTLHYQPKASVTTGEIVGMEALVRWPDRNGQGPVPPSAFIPLAEQAGIIRHLTRWVVAKTIEQQATWRNGGLCVPVSVNLSAQDLRPSLVKSIEKSLDRWSLPPEAIAFEVTESAVMADPRESLAVLEQLAAAGHGVAIDDFGTGHSSLSYLRDLRATELKIDRSFVWNAAESHRDRALLEAMVTLGKTFGLCVVAEGVEDAPTVEMLAGMGVDVMQGFHIARPLPPEQLAEFLETRRAA
jgi:EAL domain-containing protein (putative c-di-GMP-specific phosphodiesterase class I)